MGVTKREQEIIDLDEAGLSVPEIAAKLGVSPGYVEACVKTLCRGLAGDDGFSAMIRRGSKRLLAAIQCVKAEKPRHHCDRGLW